jgi:hypothetical protein
MLLRFYRYRPVGPTGILEETISSQDFLLHAQQSQVCNNNTIDTKVVVL